MSIYIEAPNELQILEGEHVIFLAGGITNCEDWQSRAVEELRKLPNIIICNPRRKNFREFKNSSGYSESKRQIEWEFHYLNKATQILFWFSKETVQPITLFEIGTRIRGDIPLFIGIHPEYPRIFDLKIQLPLFGYDKESIVYDLDTLLRMVVNYNKYLPHADSD